MRGSVTGTGQGGTPQRSHMPVRIDLEDDVGATATADQEVLVDVNVPVMVDRDSVVPHAKRGTVGTDDHQPWTTSSTGRAPERDEPGPSIPPLQYPETSGVESAEGFERAPQMR